MGYVNDDIVNYGLSSIYYGTIVCTSLFEWSQISISTTLENNFDNGDDQPFIPIPSSHYWKSFHVGRGKGPCLSIDVCMIYMDPGVVVRDLQKQHHDVETDWLNAEIESWASVNQTFLNFIMIGVWHKLNPEYPFVEKFTQLVFSIHACDFQYNRNLFQQK